MARGRNVTLKQEWPSKTGNVIRAALMDDTEGKYDVNARNGFEYEEKDGNAKQLITRMTFMMTDILTNTVRDSLRQFRDLMLAMCASPSSPSGSSQKWKWGNPTRRGIGCWSVTVLRHDIGISSSAGYLDRLSGEAT